MSDSREAYVKWRQDRGIRIGDDPIPATEFWDAAWQAAQAQAGNGEAVGKVYYTGNGFLDVDWFTSNIPDDALLYTRPQPTQPCPYIVNGGEGTS